MNDEEPPTQREMAHNTVDALVHHGLLSETKAKPWHDDLDAAGSEEEMTDIIEALFSTYDESELEDFKEVLEPVDTDKEGE